MPLSVDEKEVALVPKLLPGSAVKSLLVRLGLHITVVVDLCNKTHGLLLTPTLQMVSPFMSPVISHLKMKVSPGQVGGAGVNSAAISPGKRKYLLIHVNWYL